MSPSNNVMERHELHWHDSPFGQTPLEYLFPMFGGVLFKEPNSCLHSTPRQVLISSHDIRIFVTLATVNHGVGFSSPFEGSSAVNLGALNIFIADGGTYIAGYIVKRLSFYA